jgi:hypothetical protein
MMAKLDKRETGSLDCFDDPLTLNEVSVFDHHQVSHISGFNFFKTVALS